MAIFIIGPKSFEMQTVGLEYQGEKSLDLIFFKKYLSFEYNSSYQILLFIFLMLIRNKSKIFNEKLYKQGRFKNHIVSWTNQK